MGSYRYLKTVDRFNDLTVTGFVTASRILLTHLQERVLNCIAQYQVTSRPPILPSACCNRGLASYSGPFVSSFPLPKCLGTRLMAMMGSIEVNLGYPKQEATQGIPKLTNTTKSFASIVLWHRLKHCLTCEATLRDPIETSMIMLTG